jgi:hypothetical protein
MKFEGQTCGLPHVSPSIIVKALRWGQRRGNSATGSGAAEKPEASALPLTRKPDSYFFADPKTVSSSPLLSKELPCSVSLRIPP